MVERFSLRSFWNTVRLLALCIPFFVPPQTSAQGTDLEPTPTRKCTRADFDAYLQFLIGPGDYYTIIIKAPNISPDTCVFDGLILSLPMFVPDRVSTNPPFTLCQDCGPPLPAGAHPLMAPATISPGQVVQQTIRWKTAPPDGVTCLQPQWMSGSVSIVAPSLLKEVCSNIEVTHFSVLDAPISGQAMGEGQAQRFELTSTKSAYSQGEGFSLRVSDASLGAANSTKEETCPRLYLRQRSPDGATRIDELEPLAFKGCPKPVLGHDRSDWKSGFDLSSGANSRWRGFGEHTMQVFQLAGSVDDPELRFLSSNILRVQIADAAKIPRKWGPRVKGVGVDITLDKDTFRIGEDIPLHLAIEDFDADVPIYSWDPLWDPCFVVAIEVQDIGGRALSESERFPLSSICMGGHGFGPRPIAKGEVIPLEKSLRGEQWLPNHPGRYVVVVTWAPCAGCSTGGAESGFSWKCSVYAVVRAKATINIVGSKDTPGK